MGCPSQLWKVSLRSSQPTYTVEYPENGNALRVVIQQAKAAHHRKRSCSNERRRKLILIEGIFEALPDRREDFVKLALQTMAASQLEKGCSLYRFTADLQDPTHFTLTELWETDEDLKAHHTSDGYKRFFAELPQLGARAETISHGKIPWCRLIRLSCKESSV